MLNKKSVIDLYLKYGFVEGPHHEDYLVFFSQNGYFQNTEIVILNDAITDNDVNKIEYESLGYSVRIKKFKNLSQVHDGLFNGFFNTKIAKRKLEYEYNTFCEQQKQKLSMGKYEYISGGYIENGLKHDQHVVDRILELFDSDERQLIILEASAGFGKTCTSFEVISALMKKNDIKIPLLAELSKNRKASVFRYVLLSEIDQKFPTLSSDLVTSEIQDGRILLIVDGFDELLSKSYLSQQESETLNLKEAQTMLDTIAQLIPEDSKTKILLTSRKSSIFVGENYDNWVSNNLAGCNITRIQLTEPSVRDWIGYDKMEILKNNGVDLSNILNPVLLTLLKNECIDGFDKKYTSHDALVTQYLILLLKREKTRQDLPLDTEEQMDIMSDLAIQMVKLDISAEEIDFIKLIISEIIAPKISEFLKRYDYRIAPSEHKPNESEFINKLSQHALLDRISTQSNLIGFINEFIFGLMIGKGIIDNKLCVDELKGKYLDIVITAYSSYNIDKRRELHTKLTSTLSNESAQRQLNASILLLDHVKCSFSNEYFDGILFGDKLHILDARFNGCFFSDCIFDKCTINTDAFNSCQFYNCYFYDVKIIPGATLNCELTFSACVGHEDLAKKSSRAPITIKHEDTNYEKLVLEQFWKPGYERAEPNRAYAALLKGFASNEKQFIAQAIENLVKEHILHKRIRVYELNFEKIEEIKTILGR